MSSSVFCLRTAGGLPGRLALSSLGAFLEYESVVGAADDVDGC